MPPCLRVPEQFVRGSVRPRSEWKAGWLASRAPRWHASTERSPQLLLFLALTHSRPKEPVLSPILDDAERAPCRTNECCRELRRVKVRTKLAERCPIRNLR